MKAGESRVLSFLFFFFSFFLRFVDETYRGTKTQGNCKYHPPQNSNHFDRNRLVHHRRDMDVRERGKVLPHLDHVDGYRIVAQPQPREQSVVGVAGRRLLLDGHRGLEGHLSKILSQHPDHVRSRLLLGQTVGGNSAWVQGSARPPVGGGHGGRFLEVQRDEITADDHPATAA